MKPVSILLFLVLISCANTAVNKELSKVQGQLEKANSIIYDLERAIEPEGSLIHLVFFKAKPEADLAAFVDEIKKLEAIEEVIDLEVGPYEDLDDSRALSDYSIMMKMSFADKAGFQEYQTHPIHLALKNHTKVYMAAPPSTYDFIKK